MRPGLRRTLVLAMPLVLASAPPADADFNDVLQIICDVDNPALAGCAATPDGLRYVSAVGVSPDDEHVYSCSALEDNDAPDRDETLSAFSRAPDGTLTLVDQESEGVGGVTTLKGCSGLAVSPDGKHVYTAASSDFAVTWFARSAMTGALTFTAGDSLGTAGPGSNLGGVNAVVVSPDDEHVYVASRIADAVVAFSRDTTSGDLTEIGDYFDNSGGIDGLEGAEDIAISPDGKHVYVAGKDDDAVAVFSRDTNSGSGTFGELTFVEARFDGVGGVDGLEKASSVALDPSGQNLYVATERNDNVGDWLAVFSRNSMTGALTFLESFASSAVSESLFCGGVGPTESAVVVSPDGLFVAVSSPFLAALATFSRAADGTLTLVESICDDILVDSDDIGSIVDLAVSADGESLYSAGGPFSILSTVDYECGSPNVDLTLTLDSVSDVRSESACRKITFGPDYDVLSAGDVKATSPLMEIGGDVSFEGTVSLINAVP